VSSVPIEGATVHPIIYATVISDLDAQRRAGASRSRTARRTSLRSRRAARRTAR
jgi:hypothetical protein